MMLRAGAKCTRSGVTFENIHTWFGGRQAATRFGRALVSAGVEPWAPEEPARLVRTARGKRALVLLSLGLAATLLAAQPAGRPVAHPPNNRAIPLFGPSPLRIAYPEIPPYAFTGPDGNPTGIVIEMLQWLGAQSEFVPHFLPMSRQAAVRALEQGKITAVAPLVAAGFRKYGIARIPSLFPVNFYVYVPADNRALRSLRDLAGKRIALLKWPFLLDALNRRELSSAIPVYCARWNDLFTAVESGRADALIAWPPLMSQARTPSRLRRISPPVCIAKALVAISRRSKAQQRLFTVGIDQARRNDVLARLYTKWTGAPFISAARDRARQNLAMATIGILVVVGVFVAVWQWNDRLRKTVARRTAELEKSEKRFQTIANHTADWEFWLGPDWSPRWVSPSVKRFTGFSPEESLNMPAPYPASILHADDRPRLKKFYEQLMDRNMPAEQEITLRFHDRNNSWHWGAMRCIRIIAHGAGEGEISLRAGIRDVTKEHNTQVELEKSERRYRQLYENLRDGFVEMDLDGRILRWNAPFQKMVGYSDSELRGMNIFQITPAGSLSRERRIFAEQVLLEGFSQLYEKELISNKGGRVPVECRTHLNRGPRGTPLGYWTILRDISQRRQDEKKRAETEAQLLEARRLESLTQLAGGVAHDFNNILMVIRGNAELAQDDLPGDHPVQGALVEMIRATERGEGLCKQMLAFSGKSLFQFRKFAINQFLEENRELFVRTVTDRGELRIEPAPGQGPIIQGAPTQIQHAVLNLLENAAEALPADGGLITLRAGVRHFGMEEIKAAKPATHRSPGRFAFIEVEDNGEGIPKSIIAQVFDPFFSTRFPGRGLGLPAVLGICAGHRGLVLLKSLPGLGTRVLLLFRLDESAPSPPAPPPPKSEIGKPAAVRSRPAPKPRQKTVLVVDDEDGVRDLARRLLEREGYAVLTAADGRQALEIVRKERTNLDCVLLDMTMPEMDGQTAFLEIHAIAPELPVILASGYSTREIKAAFAGPRPAEFLHKPMSREQLLTAIQAAIRRAQSPDAPA